MKQKGFTLLEVMIAVSITALIGIASANLLSNVVETKNKTDIRSRQLIELQRFNQTVSRDAEQLINRAHRDVYGNENGALIIDGTEYLAEWTRLGWRNSPISEDPRSTMQRVAYQLHDIEDDACETARKELELTGIIPEEGSCLVRYFWDVLDLSSDSEPRTQVLLNLVEELEIEILARTPATDQGPGESNWYTTWPSLTSGGESAEYPAAMQWKITLPIMGEIERLWLLAYDDQ